MEDVTKLTKEEFLKFLNCPQSSSQPISFTIFGPNNQLINLTKQGGLYKACGIELEENTINNIVLRIPLPKINFTGLSLKELAGQFETQLAITKRKKHNAVVSQFSRNLNKKKIALANPTGKNKLKSSIMDTSHKEMKGDSKDHQNFILHSLLSNKPTYYLSFPRVKHPEDGRLNYAFETLVKDIKNMKLPSASWKIKVIVRNNKISAIIFTNKCVLERTVTFSAKSELFEIVIENKPAILLGCPPTVECINDIEVLLNIIHTISANNPMVFYK
ncbi:uncharacterized protein LOC132705061 [Cylas formicarius]|uniref:uncharacterized protein LOC132704850 n=1 Tax=Cylas formicarius TaxID=197179 RepID=UPI002958BB6D|nr:uncharacterized protein LOC132704850 [Cylas formicarius]XP_060531474.1 uncharacterized protein LOC132705061 [Cylas formicarius]